MLPKLDTPTESEMNDLKVGAIVQYLLYEGRIADQSRPAIITKILDKTKGKVSLTVFTVPEDAWNAGIKMVAKAYYSKYAFVGTWRWLGQEPEDI